MGIIFLTNDNTTASMLQVTIADIYMKFKNTVPAKYNSQGDSSARELG